jgi:hypothetical protein
MDTDRIEARVEPPCPSHNATRVEADSGTVDAALADVIRIFAARGLAIREARERAEKDGVPSGSQDRESTPSKTEDGLALPNQDGPSEQ